MNETPKPFDHRLPQHVADFVAAWLTYVSQDPARPVASVHLPDGNRLQLTLGELAEIRDRVAFTRHEAEQLAAKCATYRERIGELEAASTPPRTVWALDHQWRNETRLYSTEQLARAAAEKYTRENCDQELTDLAWIPVPDEPGAHKLVGRVAGHDQPLSAEMWVSPMVIDGTEESAEAETADKLPRDCPECGRGLGPGDGDVCYDCGLDREAAAATADQAQPIPVHFTTTGTLPACDAADPALPLTLAFDPDDDQINCGGCRLWLAGYRARRAL